MTRISKIKSREILDSRGNPTIESEVCLTSGSFGKFAVPSGASTGKNEALELRDNDYRFQGKGVLQAVNNVNSIIANSILGKKSYDQEEIDYTLINLDNTKNKSKLGANAILSISMANAHASAMDENLYLYEYLAQKYNNQNKIDPFIMPLPMINVINGGAHSNNKLNIQEFMIIPIGMNTFSDALRYSAEVFYSLKKLLHNKGYSTNTGDEGGFAPDLSSDDEALELLLEAINNAGFSIGKDFVLALDVAASELYKDNKYIMNNKLQTSDQLINKYKELIDKYHIVSIEDPLSEDDIDGWKNITKELSNKIQIVGDDIFVTNPEIFSQMIQEKIANSILIKVNQIGTLTETIQTINMAKENNYNFIISHRSGETEDVSIAHLAVGLGGGQIKTGSLSRTDRIAKYNELLRIEHMLGDKCIYGGYSKKQFKYIK